MSSGRQLAGKGADHEVQRFLAFSLGNEEYAIPLLSVKEVIAIPDITPIPYTAPHFLGVMNLRGQVISVLDLRIKFKMKKAERTQETTIIICNVGSLTLGAVVDSVNSVLAIKSSDINPRPELESHAGGAYISGVARQDQSLIVLIDIVKALNLEDRAAIQNAEEVPKKSA